MGFHVQLDLKAIEQAPTVARAGGITLEQQLAGLVLMYHYVWAKKSDRATAELLMGWFGVARSQLERLVDAEVAFGHMAPLSGDSGVWRIRGAKRYFRLRERLSEGGKKSAGNLRQFTGAQQEQAPPTSSAGAAGAGDGPTGPAPGRKPRELSGQEACWDVMERLRVEHCRQLEMEPGSSKKPKLCNQKLLEAVEAVGIVDSIADGATFTRWDMLTLLFERYLAQERIGLKDREGNACTPPWPIPLFLAPNVLAGFWRDYQEEQAA